MHLTKISGLSIYSSIHGAVHDGTGCEGIGSQVAGFRRTRVGEVDEDGLQAPYPAPWQRGNLLQMRGGDDDGNGARAEEHGEKRACVGKKTSESFLQTR